MWGVSNPGLQLYLTTCTTHYSAAPPITLYTIIAPSLHYISSSTRTGSGVSVPLLSGSALLDLLVHSVRIWPLSPCQHQHRQYDHRSSQNASYVMTSPLVWPSSSLLLVSGITRIAATAWSLETAQLWQTGRCPCYLSWSGLDLDMIKYDGTRVIWALSTVSTCPPRPLDTAGTGSTNKG